MDSTQALEKHRLISLHQGIIKARWFFTGIYLLYGLSLMVLTRIIQVPAFTVEHKPVMQWIGTGFLVFYNLYFRHYLKKEKKLTVQKLKRLSFFQVGCDLVFVSFMFYSTGALEGPGASLLLFPLVVAVILFAPLGVVVAAGLIVLVSGLITLVEHLGILPHHPLYISEIASKIYENPVALFYTFFSIAASVIAIAVYFVLTSKILRQVEESLRQRTAEVTIEKNKIEAVVTNLTDGLILLDKDERIALINPEAISSLRLKEKLIMGKKIDEISDFPHLTELYKVLGEKIEWTGQKHELTLKRPLTRYFQVLTVPVVSKEKERIGIMIILHDVTREKEIEHLKTEFVSIAAHQLRTPLSATKWTLRMILDGDAGSLSKEQTELLEGGYQSNERMIEMINDLLNVARIEEGRFLYEMSPVSLEEITQQVLDSSIGLVKKKNIKLNFIKPKEPLPEVEADKEKIGLAIQNLIENALKYTPGNNQVTISIRRDRMNLEIMVKDSGMGIPAHQQERVFTKFFRGDNALRMESEGTGMGLFISKSIVEKHGGRIWFESQEGKGTTFWFTLPLKSRNLKHET